MAYHRLREGMRDKITAVYYRPANLSIRSTKDIVLASSAGFSFSFSADEVETLRTKIGSSSILYNQLNQMGPASAGATIPFETQSPKELKAALVALELLPDRAGLQESLELFNQDEGIRSGTAHTELMVGSLMADSALAADSMSGFQEQLNGFEGSLPINVNFNDMQRGMLQVLNGVVVESVVKELTDVHHANLTVGGPYIDFNEADSITISFGKRHAAMEDPVMAISAINYLVKSSSLTRQPLRVGYMTNIVWNKELNDPLILATLKNYNMLVQTMKAAGQFGSPGWSFMDFLNSNPGDFGADENFVWDDMAAPPKPVPTDHILLREAYRLGLIDLTDVKDLEKGFSSALSDPKMVKKFREQVINNPEVYAKVRASIKKKTLGTGVDVLKEITKVLESGGPLMMAGVKPDSPLGQLLRKIGVQELAKEAWICATFGVAPAFARITKAAGGAFQQAQAGIEAGGEGINAIAGSAAALHRAILVNKHRKTKPPKPSISIPKPKPPEFPSIDKDLWPQLLKVLVDTLIQMVFQIIKALAELLKEACKLNNPRASDYGDTDVAGLVNDNLSDDFRNLPNISTDSALDQVFKNDNLTRDQVLGGPAAAGYLSALSEILSSMEICSLFTNREGLPSDTVDKIIDFNLSYDDLSIRSALNTPSAVLGFFANLATIIDITDFCNELANDLYQADIEELICIPTDAIPDRINEVLLDMAENGVQLDNPLSDLQDRMGCPRRKDHISNPLVNNAIPTLMQTVADVVEREFINGVSAAQQILKEPNITQNESSTMIAESITAASSAGTAEPSNPVDSQVSQDILDGIKKAFDKVGGFMDRLDEFCDVGAILGVEADAVEDVIGTVVDIMRDMLNDPGFSGGVADLQNRLTEISGAFSDPNGPGASGVATQYEFPPRFRDQFQTYLTEIPVFNPIKNLSLAEYQTVMTNGQVRSEHFNAYSSYSNYDSYKPINLKFTLPRRHRPTFIPDPAGAIQPVRGSVTTANPLGVPNRFGIPKFIKAPEPAGGTQDHIMITFPDADTAATKENFIDVTVKSQLLPTPGGAANFTITDAVPSITNDRNTNPYVSLFSEKIIAQIPHPAHGTSAEFKETYTREIDTVLFPAVFAGQVESMFNFIQQNGIFDTEKLNSLNFFHDNSACLPADVADLMDMGPSPAGSENPSAILDQLQEEMLDAMCHDTPAEDDDNPTGTRIRDVLRFGLFQMLIQIHIAQFIIKNIFVFSAFEIDDLLNLPTVKQFMSVTIRNQIMKLLTFKPLVGEKIVEYYNKKMKRAKVNNRGGLLNSAGEVVFPVGTDFTLGDLGALIEYTTEKRIFDSRRSVSNAVQRSSNKTNPKDFDRAFIEDVLTIQPSFLGAALAGSPPPTGDWWETVIYFAQDPKQTSGGTLINGTTWGSVNAAETFVNANIGVVGAGYRDRARRKLSAIGSDPAGKIFPYGKLVLERQVVWDNVIAKDNKIVPDLFRTTTGREYGLELSIFMAGLFDTVMAKRMTQASDRKLEFTNLAMKYKIVYYLPNNSGATQSLYPPNEPLFYDAASLHNHLQCDISPSGDGSNKLIRFVLATLDGELPLATEISTTEKTTQIRWSAALAKWAPAQVPVLQTQMEGYGYSSVTNPELTLITEDPVFKDYFDKTFNRTLTSLIPIMYNFYLTSDTFPAMDGILMGAKLRCLEIFTDSVLGQEMIAPPVPSYTSPQAEAANLADVANDPFSGVQQSARDFILKMLIETPINILRGVAETMDPHVGISKIIRDISAMIFNEMAKGLDASEPVRFLREGPLPAPPVAVAAPTEPPPPPPPPAAPPNPAAATVPVPAADPGPPPIQVDGMPPGTVPYKILGDETWEYARQPVEPPGAPAIWHTRRKGNEKWINLSQPEPNIEAIYKLQKSGVPLTAEEAAAYATPQQGQGIELYVFSDALDLPAGMAGSYQYAKNADGDWLTRPSSGSGSDIAWSKAQNLSNKARKGAAWALEVVATLEDQALPLESQGIDVPTDSDPAAPADPGGSLDAMFSTETDQAIAAAATDIGDLPIDTILRNGDEGQDVRILQTKLEQLGYELPQYHADGIFGAETENAVNDFQSASNIPITGIVDSDTWGALTTMLTAAASEEIAAATAPGAPGVGPFPDMTGEKLMELMFCVLAMAMEAAASGFVLGVGAPSGLDRKGNPKDTTLQLPSPDWKNFVGQGNVPNPESLAVFIGNPPKVPFSTPGNPFNFGNQEVGAQWDGLTYVEAQEDPRDPRNNVPAALRDNLFPRINMDGVDFTGTFLGLLMMPPGPFGIVYLLLMLLKNALEEAMKSDESDEDSDAASNVSEGETSSEC
jgi:peptidoglycan hydrolase-like protein with peptidoglycan-binding domain